MTSILETVRTALTTAGVVTDGWPCYIGYMPDVGRCLTLIGTGGFPQDTHDARNRMPTFQVSVRSEMLEYAECAAKIEAARAALENADLSGVRLLHAMSEPLQWNDARNRTVMSLNFRTVVDA